LCPFNLNERHRAIAASGPRPGTINELKNGENNRSAIYSKPVSKKQSKQTKVMFVSSYKFRL